MPDSCTCGAQLPEGARFCHRCGKPQRESAVEAPPEAAPPHPVVSIAGAAALLPPLGPSFHNPVAVRVGFFAASLASLLSSLPLLNLGFVIWWLSAGFFSVHLYRRRTGESLTVKSGARLGWITGVLTFVIFTVVFTVSIASGDFPSAYRERLNSVPVQNQDMQQAMDLLQTPAGLALFLFFVLLFLFMLVTSTCTAGGALGAKILEKESR
jgi:hypothetical protein